VAAAVLASVKTGEVLLDQPLEDLLWICQLGAYCVALGLLFRLPTVNAVGTLWLVFGLPMWILSVASGEPLRPLSLLTHTVSPALGAWGMRSLGVPKHAWWQALLALFAVQGVCRLATPPRSNVNLAFSIYPGWERSFGSYRVYFVAMSGLALASFGVTQAALARLLGSHR
jgi:hypothetical protein